MSLLIVDYGMGNLRSVSRALEEIGASFVISSNPATTPKVAGILVPGVGSFAEGMQNLTKSGMAEYIRAAVQDEHVPVLGICLGMQLLATSGFEGGETAGLDLIPGEVRLMNRLPGERLPHVGWNEVAMVRPDALLATVPALSDFYFVHSYVYNPVASEDVIAWTPYGGRFPSVIGRGIVRGVQFHPERSSKPGFQVLKNFVAICYG